MSGLKEKYFEQDISEHLNELGWIHKNPNDVRRLNLDEVIDYEALSKAIFRINGDKDINDKIVSKTINSVKKINDVDLGEMNYAAWNLLIDGVKVFDDENNRTLTIRLISENSNLNEYWNVRQLKVQKTKLNHRDEIREPDIVLYINGLPVVNMELKSPTAKEKAIDAFKQNESLKVETPNLWKFNVINFVSNKTITYYGSTLSSLERMHKVKEMETRDGINIVDFLFSKDAFFKFITTFSFFSRENNKLIKYMAAPHQIMAVNNTANKIISTNDNKGGIVWHTQGSGKSVTMLMLAKELLNLKEYPTATILIVTDRRDLDQQLYGRFSSATDYLRIIPTQIKSRQQLVDDLNDKRQFGLYFTTVQKFDDNTGVLSDREDIFVLIDEAHRSQNNIDRQDIIDKEKKEINFKYGFAYYMRHAFPNSKITGFTGTPLMNIDKNSKAIYGDYNHTYLMNDSVEDGTTVPINYEMRLVDYGLDNNALEEMDRIQKAYADLVNEDDELAQKKFDEISKSVTFKDILENEKVIEVKAKDMLQQWDKRSTVLHGKAMLVAFNRVAAFKYWKTIINLRPELKDKILLIMTDSNKDTEEMKDAIVPKAKLDKTIQEFRKPDSKYKILIVVDMLLTGFDVPDLDTMFLDKILKWHNLMQAAARVNRTYKDHDNNVNKESGLIIDYIGIWKYLSEALLQYSGVSNSNIDFQIQDVQKAKDKVLDIISIINDNYVKGISDYYLIENDKERYDFIIQALESLKKLDENSKENKAKFIKIAKNLEKCYKMSFTTLDEKEIVITKGIILIKNQLLNSNLETDENLQNTISQIKELVKNSVNTSNSEVQIKSTSFSRNINSVAEVMMKEAEQYEKEAPSLAMELMISSIKMNIEEIGKTKPTFKKMISEKLKEIIEAAKDAEDVEHMLRIIKRLGEDVLKEKSSLKKVTDPQLEAFYNIVANDEYFKDNESSEVMREIAQKLVNIIRKQNINQYDSNPRIAARIDLELRKLLKNDYDYPPKRVGDISKILIDAINQQIHLNKNYFIEKNKGENNGN